MVVQYRVVGEIALLRIPTHCESRRRDELWRHTCAELFVAAAEQEAYCEFNFSPSTEWSACQFDAYRRGMRPAECTAPTIEVWRDAHELRMTVHCALPASLSVASLQVGVSMVIEAANGQISYWALKHPADMPDFHHRDGFVLEL
jgi:hypothetical protein